MPREIRIHQKLDLSRPPDDAPERPELDGFNHIIKSEGYRLMMEQRRYLIYLEYCEGGDLWECLKSHFGRRRRPRQVAGQPVNWHQGENENDLYRADADLQPPTPIPEGFIWHVFKSLVYACATLHFGKVNDDGTYDPNWDPITHLDIKMNNIFLIPKVDENDENDVYHVSWLSAKTWFDMLNYLSVADTCSI